jgi:hypothetical protein
MFRVNKKFVVLMIISYIFAFIQGGDLPYRIFYGFSISFIIGLLYILVEQRNVEIQVKLNRQLFSTGDHGEFTIVVKNYGILPNPYLCVMSKTLASIDPDYRKYKSKYCAINQQSQKSTEFKPFCFRNTG